MKKCGIKKDIVDKVPSCITSGRRTALPTSGNWTMDLWERCNEKCGEGPIGGTTWAQRNPVKAILRGVVAGGGGGVLIGGAIRFIRIRGVDISLANRVTFGEVVKTATWAVIGGTLGGLFGGSIGGVYAQKFYIPMIISGSIIMSLLYYYYYL